MRRKRYALTRRKKALINCAICLALIVASLLLNDYQFTREDGYDSIEPNYSIHYPIYGLEELVSLPKLPLKGTGGYEHSLRVNDYVIVHAGIRFHISLGWCGDHTFVLDCSAEDKPAYIASHEIYSLKDDTNYLIIFGRVDDPEISKVEAVLWPESISTQSPAEDMEYLTTESFISYGGHRYFYIEHVYSAAEKDAFHVLSANFYNVEGKPVYTENIVQGLFTSMG